MFIKHFYFNEIGSEVIGQFKFWLEERFLLKMPYWRQIYETQMREYDWLADTNGTVHTKFAGTGNVKDDTQRDINTTLDTTNKDIGKSTGQSDGNTTSKSIQTDNTQQVTDTTNNQNSSGSGTYKNLHSDLPQANYANVDYGSGLDERETTDTTKTDSTGKSTTKNTGTTQVDGTGTTTDKTSQDTQNDFTGKQVGTSKDIYTGNQDSKSNTDTLQTRTGALGSTTLNDMLLKYRNEVLINLYEIIFDDCRDLFMLVGPF